MISTKDSLISTPNLAIGIELYFDQSGTGWNQTFVTKCALHGAVYLRSDEAKKCYAITKWTNAGVFAPNSRGHGYLLVPDVITGDLGNDEEKADRARFYIMPATE